MNKLLYEKFQGTKKENIKTCLPGINPEGGRPPDWNAERLETDWRGESSMLGQGD